MIKQGCLKVIHGKTY